MFQALRSLFSPSSLQLHAHEAYVQLVSQSRKPFFYKECSVPDTVDGRFDVMALHLFLVIHRLRGETSQDTAEFIRLLTEVFFSDMDRSLREMGVGDTGVPFRVKKMAQAFYGRLSAYEQSMDKPEALAESLTRNIYRGVAIDRAKLQRVIDYAQRNSRHLATQLPDDLLNGRLNFLD